MAIDRQTIEKKDFPIGRRGYDVAAVDEHLARIANEVDQLSSRPQAPANTLASTASDQVRAIVEAAESTANQIQEQAEAEARSTREAAETDAKAKRDEATTEAREYVARIAEGSSSLSDRVDGMEQELTALLDQLRTGANRLTSDLTLLEEGMAVLREATGAGPAAGSATATPVAGPEPEPEPLPEPEPEPEPEPPLADTDALAEADAAAVDLEEEEEVVVEVEVEAEPVVEEVTEVETGPASAVSGDDDAEGARLVALNMALNGTPRDETDQYLAEHFELEDRAALLDEVYATVGE